MKKIMSVAITGIFFLLPHAKADKFANQFVEFQLPAKWECSLEGAEWVCQSQSTERKRDAIVILAAKLRGDQDTLEQYLSYLKEPKSYTSIKGQPVKSEPKYAKTVKINEHPWVDSLHLESEIPGFYTRYLATVKEDIGVLVTYSINKLKYSDYLNEFEDMVRTLKVFRKAGGLNAAPKDSSLFEAAVPQNLAPETVFPSVATGAPGTTAATGKGDDLWFYGILLVAAVVGFVIIIRKKKKNQLP